MIDIANHLAMPVKENATKISKPSDCGGGSSSIQKPAAKRSGVDMKDVLLKGVTSSSSAESEELMLEVTCGQNQAALYMSRLQLGSKGTCVLFENAWLTPNEFQYISGRETAKDWKRSIKHHGKSLKVLISKGILTTSPLRCNCGQCAQTKDKDGSKYMVNDETKIASGPLRDAFVTDSTKHLDSAKDLPDRRFFRIPGDCGEKLRDALTETSPTKSQRPLTEQCFSGHSTDGAKYLSSSCDKGLYRSALHDASSFSSRQEGFSLMAACSAEAVHMGKCMDMAGQELHRSTSDTAEAKHKAKRKSDGNETGEFSKDQVELRCSQNGDYRKSEAGNNDTTESGQKKSGSVTVKPTSGAAGSWTHGNTSLQMEQSHHYSETTGSKSTHEKVKKLTNSPSMSSSSMLDRPSCNQVNATPSGKSSLTNAGNGIDPARLASSDSSFIFPSFSSPYYPMIAGPQLPAYYPNPYMWPVPFPANPSTCSYGWTAPSDITAPSCLRSPNKESLDCNPSSADQAFNFPWMKRSSYCSAESQSCRDTAGDTITSGKRKLEADSSDYFPPSKHPFYLSDSLRPAFGDAIWPAYSPTAAALDFRFLPYSLPSYIPDGRATHGMFANNFLKGSENPAAGGLGLYQGLFPSPCLGVNSR